MSDSRELAALVLSPGYTPGRRDLTGLAQLLVEADEELAAQVERVFEKADPTRALEALTEAFGALGDADEGRVRLVRAVGRLETDAVDFLLGVLAGPSERARRAAIRVLGKKPDARALPALTRALENAPALPEARVLVEALGKSGDAATLEALAKVSSADPELTRLTTRARAMLARTLSRPTSETRADAGGDFDLAAKLDATLVFRCRRGLEDLLTQELAGLGFGAPRGAGSEWVEARGAGPLARVHEARLWFAFGFVAEDGVDPADVSAEGIVARLTGPTATRIFRAFTRGPARFRLRFESGGKQRALMWRVADLLPKASRQLVNDPTQAQWTVTLRRDGDLLLEPTGLFDPRFAYREADVPAASHPTVAAALARIAEARPDDVVWDPFCGSGTELVERAMCGKYTKLIGTDLDSTALAAAQRNVTRAGLERVSLLERDARVGPGETVTLVLSNPPLGRRVARESGLFDLLDDVMGEAARALAAGGRLVWIAPDGARARETARRVGLSVTRWFALDMNGFSAELQAFEKRV